MADKYIRDIKETKSITETLAISRNRAISGIMNIVEVSDLSDKERRKIREIVLDELNSYHNQVIKILTYVQENVS